MNSESLIKRVSEQYSHYQPTVENQKHDLAYMLYWWGLDFSAFDKKGVFSRISLILTAFHRFVLSFHHSPSFLCSRHRFIAFQLKSVRIAQNNGEWWKIGQICEKLSKSKKFMKKTPFFVKRGEILVPTNPTRFNCNFNCDKY